MTILDNFNRTIDYWFDELDHYSMQDLLIAPASGWSLGQVYTHVHDETNYFLGQVKECLSSDDSSDGVKTEDAVKMFSNNDFPDLILDGPASNYEMPQPESKEKLKRDLIALRAEINQLGQLVLKNLRKGKTRHPGFDFFNAEEWFQFAEMHMRHHFRQKKRIDQFLKNSKVL